MMTEKEVRKWMERTQNILGMAQLTYKKPFNRTDQITITRLETTCEVLSEILIKNTKKAEEEFL